MERDEHIAWSKSRALELIDAGDEIGAMSSIVSDMTKGEDTALSIEQIREARDRTLRGDGSLRHWIESLQ